MEGRFVFIERETTRNPATLHERRLPPPGSGDGSRALGVGAPQRWIWMLPPPSAVLAFEVSSDPRWLS